MQAHAHALQLFLFVFNFIGLFAFQVTVSPDSKEKHRLISNDSQVAMAAVPLQHSVAG